MMLGDPLVSVVIPTFNNARLLPDAVDSVLAQTYVNYEIIVVDDGSTDDTSTAVTKYRDKVRYHRQENCGSSNARQVGFDLSSGRYLAALDADDLWLPEKLEYQVAALESHEKAGLCYSDGYRWSDGTSLSNSPLLSSLYAKGITGWQFSYFFKINPAPTSSMMFPVSAIKRVGGYNPRLKWGDFEICARICAFYPAVFVDRPLMVYRVHGNNSSSLVTRENIVSRLDFKRTSRVSALSSIPKDEGDFSIRIFRQSPIWLQFCMLLWWRLAYGSSRAELFRGLTRYGKRLLRRK
jgi:glycosyltransferase involved in cell wall biosynthesis